MISQNSIFLMLSSENNTEYINYKNGSFVEEWCCCIEVNYN